MYYARETSKTFYKNKLATQIKKKRNQKIVFNKIYFPEYLITSIIIVF